MSEENVEVVRALYERLARGDFGSIADLGDDYEFITSPELPDAGTYRGEAARRWLRSWVESFEELTIEATEIIGVDERVFIGILQRGRPRGSDTAVEGRWWGVTTVREGEPARTQLFPERAQALDAAGLREEREAPLSPKLR